VYVTLCGFSTQVKRQQATLARHDADDAVIRCLGDNRGKQTTQLDRPLSYVLIPLCFCHLCPSPFPAECRVLTLRARLCRVCHLHRRLCCVDLTRASYGPLFCCSDFLTGTTN